MTPQIEQLAQIAKGPVWDGNLISKSARDQLFEAGYINKESGFNFLTNDGVRVCVNLRILKS